MLVALNIELNIVYKKYGNNFRCICSKYNLTGKSNESFEEALKDLQNLISIKLWTDEGFDLNYIVTEKSIL